jgi:hypothetical protein
MKKFSIMPYRTVEVSAYAYASSRCRIAWKVDSHVAR